MHEGSEPHAFLPPLPGILAGEPRGLCAVVAQCEGALQQMIHVHVFANHLSGRGGLPRLNEIAQTKLFRRQTNGARHSIQVSFERKDALRRAKAAKRAVRRRVGGYGAAADAHIRAEIRPWRVDGAADRKSTRLNSSHLVISYAVFCLKKKKI